MEYSQRFYEEKELELAKLYAYSEYSQDVKAQPGDFLIPGFTANGYVAPPKNNSDYLKAAVGWVYSAIRPIADGIGTINFTLNKVNIKGEIQTVAQHQVLDLLFRANPVQTKFDFWSLVAWYLELCGEAPLFIDRGEQGVGKPQAIFPLSPDKFRFIPLKDKEVPKNPWFPFSGYAYETSPGIATPLSLDEVILLRYPDPARPYRGISPLHAAAKTADIDEASQDYNFSFFKNSARPDSILSTDQKLKKTQRDDLKRQLQSEFGGTKKAHRTMVLENGFKWQAMSISQKDMDFMEQQKFSRDKILSIFGTPKPIAGITEDVNLANAEIAERVFAQYTLKPKFERIVQQLNEFLIPMYPDAARQGLYLAYQDPTPNTQENRLAYYQNGIQNGWLTPNEIRLAEDLPAIEGGDITKPLINVNPLQDQTAKYLARRGVEAIAKKEKVAREEVAKAIAPKIENYLRAKMTEQHQTERTIKAEKFWHTMVKAAEGFEKRFYKVTLDIFKDQEDKINGRMQTKAVDDWLLDLQDDTEVNVRMYLPLMNEIIQKQGEEAVLLTGLSRSAFDYRIRRIQQYISDHTYDFSKQMNETTNDLVKATLNEGVKAGEGSAELGRRLRNVFDDMSKTRAERIARTEVLGASNYAAEEAYKQSGVVEAKEWLTALDERTDDICAELNGDVVGLNEDFAGGVRTPPIHPNCRCTIIPVLK